MKCVSELHIKLLSDLPGVSGLSYGWRYSVVLSHQNVNVPGYSIAHEYSPLQHPLSDVRQPPAFKQLDVID